MNVLVCIHSPFVMWNIPDEHVARLGQTFPSDTFIHARSDDEGVEKIGAADIAFSSQVTRAQLDAAPRLRWIHSPAAGVGGMLFPEMLASPVVITNSRGLSAETIAEHVLAVTLAIFRRLPHAMRSQMAREWAQDAISAAGNRRLAGARVLVVGLGAIGEAVAQRFSVLGAHVTGIRRRATHPADGVDDVAAPSRLQELLPQADVVVIAAPHTRETKGLIGARELASMSRDAVLINVSRGQLVDEAALVDALAHDRLAGAALDVFADEPLPTDSPLWTLPNVLITPHTSGFRADHWDAAVELFADNFQRFKSGLPLLNVVDKAAGY